MRRSSLGRQYAEITRFFLNGAPRAQFPAPSTICTGCSPTRIKRLLRSLPACNHYPELRLADAIELEARLSALELVVLTHVLQSGLTSSLYDPRAFALARREAWAGVASAMCEGCVSEDEESRFTHAYAAALERLGHLLVSLAEPVQEAIDEVNAEGLPPTAAPAV
jgi:hypothetical protein